MCCEQVERQLGRYVDKELSVAERDQVEAHLGFCSNCRAEFDELRQLVDGIAHTASVAVPHSLWERIERRLDQRKRTDSHARSAQRLRMRSAPWAVAAGIFLSVGLGLFGLSSIDTTAHASTIDFGVLLDALPLTDPTTCHCLLSRLNEQSEMPAVMAAIAPGLSGTGVPDTHRHSWPMLVPPDSADTSA